MNYPRGELFERPPLFDRFPHKKIEDNPATFEPPERSWRFIDEVPKPVIGRIVYNVSLTFLVSIAVGLWAAILWDKFGGEIIGYLAAKTFKWIAE